MTASAAERLALLGSAILIALGCATASAPLPVGSPLEPLPTRAAHPPDDSDRAAGRVASAVLVGDLQAADAALRRLEALERERRARDEAPSGLVPRARNARNAALDDPVARLRATRELLEQGGLDAPLHARLAQEVEGDPLALAGDRLHDARVRRIGRRLNAVSEPIGRSLLTGALLPLRLAQALLGLALTERMEDELTTPERQALRLWKDFIDRNPERPEAAALLARVKESQQRWYRTRRDRLLRRARRAQRGGSDSVAAALAERALHYAPEDREALRLQRKAAARVEARRSAEAQSLGAAAEPSAGGRALAVALLLPGADVAAAAERVLREAPDELADEARFAAASAHFLAGAEERSWRELRALASRGDRRSPMARHARALVASTEQNPYAAFRRARRAERSDRLRFLFMGPLAGGARDRDLPRPLEWLLEIPNTVTVVTGLPNRLIRLPWFRSQRRSPSVFARRYLERHPDGERAGELRTWLEDFDRDRGNYVGALRVAESQPDADPERLAALRERAARQALEVARREPRLDTRAALLSQTARRFEGTRAGRQAAAALREEFETATPQHIRLSRGFLVENPRLAGPEGLALRPGLMDGALENGELHSQGIALLGGRTLELAFVHGRDASAAPERVRRKVSNERLARLTALLQETTLRNALVDPDQEIAPDADRDLFFERARLGVTESAPFSASARSTYAYRGMREQYGLVRSRESILPVELVLQGSFDDFGLGAFPRVRMPRETPDAFLYR